ncbi:MAG: acyltransferase [Sediminibacterium sp.]|nr:acyltransferase [Sediminibacterium sp.]TXT33841.1 MAG: putative acetyltransferase [Chitinophagaceae bacterium]
MHFLKWLKKIFYQLLYKLYASKGFQYQIYLAKGQAEKVFLSTFKKIGNDVYFPNNRIVKNPQYISIGNCFFALQNLRLEAWDKYGSIEYAPEIIIGNNVCFNTDVHIGAINKVFIGDNVLIASRVYISDHSHGEITAEAIKLPPSKRALFSKGPVIIENNVWIGEGVSILPDVIIGVNSIIGANSVVTRSIPPNSVVVGNPARVIKTI